MADFNYDEYGSGDRAGYDNGPGMADKARRWINIAGAVCSVSLVLGLGHWGYKLAVRDVTGVPVMRAVAGAMRIAPANPGGEQALNQGLTVNAIAAVGTSAKPADQITLAPMPVQLQAGDVPQVAAAPPVVAAAPVVADALAPAADSTVSISGTTTPDMTVADALATVVPSDPNAMRHSIRPQSRPVFAGAAMPTKAQTVAAQTPAAVNEIDPTTIALGTRLAQLGPFETPELARAKFAELQASFGDLMMGKDMVIQPATSGGRTFYRLRASGFDNEDDTRRFCAALQAQDTDCIPVAQR